MFVEKELKRSSAEGETDQASGGPDIESTLGECEPWEDWESKLVIYSLAIGIATLIIMGIVINVFILNK